MRLATFYLRFFKVRFSRLTDSYPIQSDEIGLVLVFRITDIFEGFITVVFRSGAFIGVKV